MARPGWCGVGGEGAGGCGHALAAFKYSLNRSCVVARKRGPGGVWAVGVVRARGGVGTHWQPFKYSLNIQKMQPGVGSGEAGVVWCGR